MAASAETGRFIQDRFAIGFWVDPPIGAEADVRYKEIADVCRCAIGTVMSRLYRARQLLGTKLRDYARERNLSTERFDR